MNSETSAPSNSIAGLLRDLRDEAGSLVQQQITLAKVELKEQTSRIGGNVAQLAVAGAVTFIGTIVLLIGVGHLLGVLLEAAGLSNDTASWLGLVIVGLIVAAVGWALLAKAKKNLAQESINPRQTTETLKANQEWVQDKLQHSHESRT
jgi:uncharacterized membrane protein YqjE